MQEFIFPAPTVSGLMVKLNLQIALGTPGLYQYPAAGFEHRRQCAGPIPPLPPVVGGNELLGESRPVLIPLLPYNVGVRAAPPSRSKAFLIGSSQGVTL